MTVLDELKLMNYSIIDSYRSDGKNTYNYELIREILKDEACFFKMEKVEAMLILKTLNVSENMLEETYKSLINKQEFTRLHNEGKLNFDDEELIIKYEV